MGQIILKEPCVLELSIIEYENQLSSINVEFKLTCSNIARHYKVKSFFWFLLDDWNDFVNQKTYSLIDMDNIPRLGIDINNSLFILDFSSENEWTKENIKLVYSNRMSEEQIKIFYKNLTDLL